MYEIEEALPYCYPPEPYLDQFYYEYMATEAEWQQYQKTQSQKHIGNLCAGAGR
jgi:hypothetical protein